MIERASRAQAPLSARARFASRAFGTKRRRFTLVPITASRAGRKVAAAAIETSGTTTPPSPIARMNGRGMRMRSASPSATVRPEKIVARPDVVIVRTIAS